METKRGPARMDGIIGAIDRQERKRIRYRLDEVAEKILELHDCKDKAPGELTSKGALSRDKRRAYPRSISLGGSALGFSSAQSAGEFVIRQIIKRQEFLAAQGTTVQHVKNGRPLTEHGAKILGVPWPPKVNA